MSDMERTEFRLPDGFDVDRDVDTRLQAGEQESETTLRPKNLDEFVTGATEHKGSWWPDWLQWLKARAPAEVDAKGARIPARVS